MRVGEAIEGRSNGRVAGTADGASPGDGGAKAGAKKGAEVQIAVDGAPAHVHVVKPEDVPQELIDTEEEPVKPAEQRAASAGAVQSVSPAPRSQVARTANTLNALIHLYRGELGRMTAHRARLDTST